MKKNLMLLIASSFLMAMTMISCKKDEPLKDFTISKDKVTLMLNASETVKITSGNGDYKVQVGDAQIASVERNNAMIKIKGLKVGQTNVTVTDVPSKKQQVIAVQVTEEFTLEKSQVAIKKGDLGEVKIIASEATLKVLELTNNQPKIVDAKLKNNRISFEGLAFGQAILTVKDKSTNRTQTLTVEVTATPLNVDQTEVTVDAKQKATVAITSGSGSYEVTAADKTIAKATISGQSVMIEALKAGSTDLVLKDVESQQTVTIKVTVKVVPLTLGKNELSLAINSPSGYVDIVSGEGAIQLSTTPEDIVEVELQDRVNSQNEVDGKTIKIVPKKVGTATVTVQLDEQSQSITVTVTPITLRVAENSVELNGGQIHEVKIVEGNNGYEVTTSNAKVATAEVAEVQENAASRPYSVVRITAVAAGTATITLTDASKKSVEIVVTVKAKEEWFTVDDKGVVRIKAGAKPAGAIVMPDNGKIVADELFKENNDITSVDFKNVTKIGYESFYKCENLQSVTMPKVDFIDESAFWNCQKLEVLDLSSVTKIGRKAFQYAYGLTKLTLSKDLKSVGYQAFHFPQMLETIICPITNPDQVDLDKKSFAGVGYKLPEGQMTILYVPAEAVETFKSNSKWAGFFSKEGQIQAIK